MKIATTPRRDPWIVSAGVMIILVATSYLIYITHIHKTSEIPASIGPPTLTSAQVSTHTSSQAPVSSASYTVPATHPGQLIIDRLGVRANVLPMGVLADGALDAPKTAWDVGWYNQSTLPGSGSGALLIDGHVNDALNSPGTFYRLNTLAVGDTLRIIRGDSQTFTYNVTEVDQVPTAQVDMSKMLRSITSGQEGLNLITCGGVYDYKLRTYSDRVLVYATRTP